MSSSLNPGTEVPNLKRSMSEGRAIRSAMLTVGAWVVTLIAAVPLFSVLYMLFVEGGSRLGWETLTAINPLVRF